MRIIRDTFHQLKTHLIVSTGLGVLFLAAIGLAVYSALDVVSSDQWRFLSLIDDYYKHRLSFSEIWAAYSEQRTPGYKLLFLLDALWFHLDLLLESYAGVTALLVSATFLYRAYLASFAGLTKPRTIQLSFLVVASIIFSFNQWALYTYSLSALDSFLGNLLFIAGWFYLDRALRRSVIPLGFVFGFAGTFLLTLLTFGSGRSSAIIVATLGVTLLAIACRDKGSRLGMWRMFAVVASIAVISQVIYWMVGPALPLRGSLLDQAMVVFSHPLGAIRFSLLTVASAVVPDLLLSHTRDASGYFIGTLIIIFYLAALWLYWKAKLWQRTYLPLFLMAYSLLYLASLLIGRYAWRGMLDAGAPRYASDLGLGIVGMVWIFYLAYFSSAVRAWGRWLGFVLVLSTVCMVLVQASEIYVVYVFTSYQRNAALRYREFILSDKPDKYVVDPPPTFYCPDVGLCAEGNQILRQYGLNPFSGTAGAAQPAPAQPQTFTAPAGAASYPRLNLARDFLQPVISPQRSPRGIPGPGYWQNRADYKIDVKLDEVQHRLTGQENITYTNNSPDTLDYLWLQLEQNLYRDASRGKLATPYGNPKSARTTQGMQIAGVSIAHAGRLEKLVYSINDTNMRVELPAGLAPHGGVVHLVIDYSFEISDTFYGAWTRMGRDDTADGPVYGVAQWYPRMVVYDDIRGWNTLPHRGVGEFYLEYGDFDYSIDVPWNYLVAGTGSLVNPADVLTHEQVARLQAAAKSDKTISIVSADEVGSPASRPVHSGRLVWHFKMDTVRDAAWAASPAFVWDAARIDLKDGRPILAMAFYPRADAEGWHNTVQYLKQDIEFYSPRYYPYPYPTMVAMATPVAGMEYPGGMFLSWATRDDSLQHQVAHESAHTWFPMLVGSNEYRYAWMDEGFAEFLRHVMRTISANHAENAGLRPGYTSDTTDYMQRETVPIMASVDDIPEAEVRPLEYEKTALGLGLLRGYILAPGEFDRAFKAYIRAWAYRHPTPYDFFRFMNNETGEDLDWFWDEWFLENWKLDQAVAEVRYVDDNPAKGGLITIENKDRMVMPVDIVIQPCDGRPLDVKLPVEIWANSSTWQFKVETTGKIKSVVIDPQQLLPDMQRDNNRWDGGC